MRLRSVLAVLMLALSAFATLPARGSEVVIRMVTDGTGGRFQFEPPVVRIRTGDTVRFQASDTLHATKSIPGMIPEGAAPWWGEIGRPLSVTLTVPGIYGYKCPAHYTIGMVGLIIVGDDLGNLATARRIRHPRAAQKVFDRLFEVALSGARSKG